MGLNQDEHDKNPIWKGCDTDSRQCRAYRSEKKELVAEKLTQEVMPAQKSQATSDDFEISTYSYLMLSCLFFYAVPVVLSTRGICVVHQLLKSRKGSRPCCNAALSLSPTRAKPFSIWSEMSIQF
jgi:hypothetical protein